MQFSTSDGAPKSMLVTSSRPGEGIVVVATRARNQHGVEVLSYRRTLLVYRRGATAPYEKAGY